MAAISKSHARGAKNPLFFANSFDQEPFTVYRSENQEAQILKSFTTSEI